FLDSLCDLAYGEAKKGFTLPGFGKLVLVNRKARMGRNPATGETIKIPAKKVVKFRVAKACKDAILGAAPKKKTTKKKRKTMRKKRSQHYVQLMPRAIPTTTTVNRSNW
ncbi:MAG: HU family DNA-binding protein, partial [Synechococcaceae cyanobacterium RM1_1_27]|nr:HU family DNA-binding protein [Synechococcaceae cyanobacterium RM1_1_27]